jgi:hypothetical protein
MALRRIIFLLLTTLAWGRVYLSMAVHRFTTKTMVRRRTATSSVWVIGRILDAFSTVHRNGSGVVYRHGCCVEFVLLSFFDLCGDFRRSLLLILFHAFESIILLLEQVHQARRDFICLLWRRNMNKWWRKRNMLRERRKWREERCVHHCGSTSVDRSVEDSIDVVSFWIHRFENHNRSILEDLNHMTWFLRSGGSTFGGSPTSSDHYFEEWSSNCQPLWRRNV